MADKELFLACGIDERRATETLKNAKLTKALRAVLEEVLKHTNKHLTMLLTGSEGGRSEHKGNCKLTLQRGILPAG